MSTIRSLYSKEIKAYFNSPVAYVVLGVFLLAAGSLYYFVLSGGVFATERASMRGLFAFLPWLFMVLAPALTMRLFAEEKKTGTIESLMTLPLTERQVVIAKFLASWTVAGLGILLTIPFAISLSFMVPAEVSIDYGPVLGSYFGAILLSGVFCALGLLCSAITRDQMVSFIVALALCFVFIIADALSQLVEGPLGEVVQYLSVTHHFQGISRGVIDTRNLLYYVTVIGLALYLTIRFLVREREDMHRNASLSAHAMSGLDSFLLIASAVGSIALVNLLATDFFVRFDMTKSGAYTLSSATRTTLEGLEDPVTVRAYFSKDLPPQLANVRQYTKDMLEEYRNVSGGNFRFEFLDPQAEESDEDRATKREVKRDIFGRSMREQTSVERELQALGIQAVELQVLEDDAAKQQRAYMGLAFQYHDNKEAIPFVQSSETLEYDMTSLLRKLVRPSVPVVGVLQGEAFPKIDESLTMLKRVVEQNYELRAIDVDAEDFAMPTDLDALVVVGPKSTLPESLLKEIDALVSSGTNAALLISSVDANLREFNPTQVRSGLETLAAHYGVEVGQELVADVESTQLTMQVPSKLGRMMRQVPYPMIPELKNLVGESILTRGVQGLVIPFSTELKLKEGVQGEALIQSSAQSWLESFSPQNLAPQRQYTKDEVNFDGPHTMAVTLEGPLSSKFEGTNSESPETRLLISGSGSWLSDDFMSNGNALMAMNMIDWLVLDSDLIAVRAKTSMEQPIDRELSKSTRTMIKYGNVVGAPLLLVLYGLTRRARRQSERARWSKEVSA